MCFSGACPAEDYNGECTANRRLGLLPCEVEEVFTEDGADPEPEKDEK